MSFESKRQARARAARLGAGALHLFDWLEYHKLPVAVERVESVGVLRKLLAAGFVEAQIPEPTHKGGRTVQPPAVVTAVTPAGRQWRAKLRKDVRTYGHVLTKSTTPEGAFPSVGASGGPASTTSA